MAKTNVNAMLGDTERQLLWLRIEGYFDGISSLIHWNPMCHMCGKNRFSECEGIAKCLVQCLFDILVTKNVFLGF